VEGGLTPLETAGYFTIDGCAIRGYTVVGISTTSTEGKMKPREIKPQEVYRIIDRETGEAKGSYSRACCDEYDFRSVSEARNANFHGVFKDTEKYRIAKYRVLYELIEEDAEKGV
jgi:hypothetical protein